MTSYERITNSMTANYMQENGNTSNPYYSRLAELEDKIENGTLYNFQFQLGQKVYIACDWDINEVVDGKITEIELTTNKNGVSHRIYVEHKHIYPKTNPNMVAHRYIFTENELFISKEQAEAKLAELKGKKP